MDNLVRGDDDGEVGLLLVPGEEGTGEHGVPLGARAVVPDDREEGSHFSNSLTQLGRVARGATTRYGPGTPMVRRCATMAMTWMVLPRPISSARIPDTPFSYRDVSHLTPSSW